MIKRTPIRHFAPLVLLLGLILVGVTGCIYDNNPASTHERDSVQRQQGHYLRVQPVPFFERSLERYLMTELYKARNTALSTWSYTQSPYTGKIMWECPSIGYPVPGGTQLTNPNSVAYATNQTSATLPQAEPNGLFSPPTAQGTWVMCVNEDGTVSPNYIEDLVRTAPYPLKEVNGKLVRDEAAKPTLKIDPKDFMGQPGSAESSTKKP